MRPQEKSLNLRKKRFAFLVFTLSISFLFAQGGAVPAAIAQVVEQEPPAQPPAQWREMEDRVPKHLPIKIKVKNLQNERWLRDLEIEVTNKATKPIYFLKFTVLMPDIRINGGVAGNPIRYGRSALLDFSNPILPEDVPIKPGETVVLKYPKSDWAGWEAYAAKHNLPKSEPKRVKIIFHALNFGDGTGFKYVDGTPMPIRQRANSSLPR